MPTIEHVGERCTWEMEVTVDSSLLAVVSGELLEQVKKLCNLLQLMTKKC